MITLTPEMFGAHPRKQLDKLLSITTHHLTNQPHSSQELLTRINGLMFTSTLRSLTLPDPLPTAMLSKRSVPEVPYNYTQLKRWKEETILKYIRTPVDPTNVEALRTRQQLLYLLSQLTFKE